jgi:YidC/Oxa1 family membrane protein insertase
MKDKNMVWFIILSSLVIFFWMFNTNKNEKQKITMQTQQGQQQLNSTASVASVKEIEHKIVQEKQYEYILENNYAKITITNTGGIKSFLLKDNGKQIELIFNNNSPYPLTLNPIPNFNLKPKEFKQGKYIALQGMIDKDIEVVEYIKFNEKQGLLDISIKLTNLSSNKDVSISNFSIGVGPGLGTDENIKYDKSVKNMQAMVLDSGKIQRRVKAGAYNFSGKGWIAVDNHYFVSALVDVNNNFKNINRKPGNIPEINYSSNIVLKSKETKEINLLSYWGLKKYSYLKKLTLGLEKTVSLGLFNDIGKFVLYMMNKFYQFTGNYGIAIILITTFFQLLLFPLTRKSAHSMHEMKKIQPELNNLRIKYKDDAQKLNMEIMNLYKERKVNPFGGCLPILLQLPIFWALFTTLQNASELRNAPFIFWIKDLSQPDTVFTLGSIPINILPILMGAMMFVSQKVTSFSTMDSSQKTMMIFMPILFTIMFWSFPSGLVLYWFVSNIYTTLIQVWIAKKLG